MCYCCGRIGHTFKECAEFVEGETNTEDFAYGPWMRAPSEKSLSTPPEQREMIIKGLEEQKRKAQGISSPDVISRFLASLSYLLIIIGFINFAIF